MCTLLPLPHSHYQQITIKFNRECLPQVYGKLTIMQDVYVMLQMILNVISCKCSPHMCSTMTNMWQRWRTSDWQLHWLATTGCNILQFETIISDHCCCRYVFSCA